MKTTISFYTILFLLNIGNIFAAQNSFLTPEAICEGWNASYGAIDNMDVAYDYNILSTNGDDDELKDVVIHRKVNRQESGQKYHVLSEIKHKGADHLKIKERAFNGLATTNYYRDSGTAEIEKGYRQDRGNLMRLLLGNEILENGQPVFLHNLRGAIEVNIVTVRPKLENISGLDCHVLDFNLGDYRKTSWISHEADMLIVQSKLTKEGKILQSTTLDDLVSVDTEHGKVWYPRSAILTTSVGETSTKTAKMSVTKFVPHVTLDESVFLIDFPDGTKIYDYVLNISYIKGISESNQKTIAGFAPLDLVESKSDKQAESIQGSRTSDRVVENSKSEANIDVSGVKQSSQHLNKTNNNVLYIITFSATLLVIFFAFVLLRKKFV